GARMEARWPVAALTTRSGCGMARRAALGRRYWDIAPWCTAWPSPPTAAACSVAVAMVRCGCGTWNVASRYASCRATGPPSSTSIRRVAWSPNGTRVVGGGDDGHVYLWDASDGMQLLRLVGHHGAVTSVAWSPDGMRLASGGGQGQGEGGELIVWDAHSGQRH